MKDIENLRRDLMYYRKSFNEHYHFFTKNNKFNNSED